MTIRVAIAGGGIAGLCLARGLSQYPQFDVQVYEQVLEHKDKGGSLALHANAIGAMDLIDPAIKQAYFRKANSMLEDDEKEMSTQVIMAEGRYTGEVIAMLGRAKGRKTVARIDLIAGYQELVPKEIVHMGKRLEKVEERGDREVILTVCGRLDSHSGLPHWSGRHPQCRSTVCARQGASCCTACQPREMVPCRRDASHGACGKDFVSRVHSRAHFVWSKRLFQYDVTSLWQVHEHWLDQESKRRRGDRRYAESGRLRWVPS